MVSPSLLKAALAILLPLLACFGYYTAERLEAPSLAMTILSMLAAPLALIGASGALSLFAQRLQRPAAFWLSVGAFVVPSLFLAVAWF
jgi:hypothetical protein